MNEIFSRIELENIQ